jgi:GDP-4-dehydro-6-deoxy-D-mannose reductase
MSRRALVTGAGGFVGTRLTRHLESQGWEVVRSGHPAVDGMLPCDFQDDNAVRALIANSGPLTHVFHLAAMAFVPDAERDPVRAMDVNLNGTIRLCSALRDLAAPPRLIFIGSSEIYGPPQALPMTEDHAVNPATAYAISKAAADHYCAYLSRIRALDIVRMRPFNHAGPGQADSYVLSSFARQVAEIEAGFRPPVLETGNLEAARDFLHVDDVLRAYEAAALQAPGREAFNVCSGQAQRIQSALDQFLAMSSATIEVRHDPARMRPSDVPEVCGSSAKLTATTGWRPEIAFDTLLRDLLDYWRSSIADRTAQ